jgi:hypothetical protein
MLSRKIRRAEEHKARKAARKAGLPFISAPTTTDIPAPVEADVPDSEIHAAASLTPSPEPPAAVAPEETFFDHIPEPGFPLPALDGISPARLAANRENAKLSTGAKSPETKAISAQNHTTHGLVRHQNGNFKILTSEDATAFEKLRESLFAEHAPQTPTESILVNTMAQSSWLAERAQRLQDMCIDPDTGAITDEKKFSLYMRYQTTHTRAFHKCLNDLLKLRAEKRKAEIGFEAQRIQTEKHELKKQSHYWDVLKKDALTCAQLSNLATQNINARKENPGFEAEYQAELAKRGLQKNGWEAASAA